MRCEWGTIKKILCLIFLIGLGSFYALFIYKGTLNPQQKLYQAFDENLQLDLCEIRLQNEQSLKQPFIWKNGLSGFVFALFANGDTAGSSLQIEVYDDDTNDLLDSRVVSNEEFPTDGQYSVFFEKPLQASQDRYRMEVKPYALSEEAFFLPGYFKGEDPLAIRTATIEEVQLNGSVLANLYGSNMPLIRSYFLVAAITVLVVGAVLCIILTFFHIPFSQYTLLCILLLGSAFSCVLLPFAAPDEDIHFGTAYYYAGRVTGAIDKPLAEYNAHETSSDYTSLYDLPARVCDEVIGTYGTSLYESGDVTNFTETLWQSPLANDSAPSGTLRISVFEQTSPLRCWPSILGILLAQFLGLNGPLTVMCTRLLNICIYAVLCAGAIKLIPAFKTLLFCVMTLPITFSIIVSSTNDSLIYGLAFFMIAYTLHLRVFKKPFHWSQVLIIGLYAMQLILLGQYHLLFLPLLLFYKHSPRTKFTRQYVERIVCIVLAVAIVIVFALFLMQIVVLEENGTDTTPYGVLYLLQHPFKSAAMVLQTCIIEGDRLIELLFGGYLGWLDIPTGFFVTATTAFTIFVASLTKEGGFVPSSSLRFWCGAVGALLFFSTFSVAFKWSSPWWFALQGNALWGLQGRYFIPVLPLLLIAVSSERIRVKQEIRHSLMAVMVALNCYSLLLSCVSICER